MGLFGYVWNLWICLTLLALYESVWLLLEL
jgi:hypothetical protein